MLGENSIIFILATVVVSLVALLGFERKKIKSIISNDAESKLLNEKIITDMVALITKTECNELEFIGSDDGSFTVKVMGNEICRIPNENRGADNLAYQVIERIRDNTGCLITIRLTNH